MIVEDQQEVLAFLSNAASYPAKTGPVERIDTHSAAVFLVGDRAYKLKRAVKFDYLDFSSIELRHRACDAEIRINRRTAPSVYLGTIPIVRTVADRLSLGGQGRVVDWIVEMRRFDQDTLFDRLAAREALDRETMRRLAGTIVELYRNAEPRPDHGGLDGMRWVCEGNLAEWTSRAPALFDTDACRRLANLIGAALSRNGGLLERRRRTGLVRQCHGDLHLRNICLVDGRPTLFDAIEFNDEIACVDVLYDLAFLLMDLYYRGLIELANVVLNEYLYLMDDWEGVTLLPLFQSCRAGVRAKTSAAASIVQTDEREAERLRARAREYLAMTESFLSPPGPRLVAVGGVSGSGKSTLAAALAPRLGAPPGAVVLRSDVTRKRLYGVSPTDRLPAEAYREHVSRKVYGWLVDRAMQVVRAGHSAIVDAVFMAPHHRALVEQAARDAGVAFSGLWIDAAPEVLRTRLSGRADDASDATVAVLDRQLSQSPGVLTWRRLDGTAPADLVRRRAHALLSEAHVAQHA